MEAAVVHSWAIGQLEIHMDIFFCHEIFVMTDCRFSSSQNIATRGCDSCDEGADCGEGCGGANGGSDLARHHTGGGHSSGPKTRGPGWGWEGLDWSLLSGPPHTFGNDFGTCLWK